MLLAQFLPGYEEVRFEAASILTKIHLEQVRQTSSLEDVTNHAHFL